MVFSFSHRFIQPAALRSDPAPPGPMETEQPSAMAAGNAGPARFAELLGASWDTISPGNQGRFCEWIILGIPMPMGSM